MQAEEALHQYLEPEYAHQEGLLVHRLVRFGKNNILAWSIGEGVDGDRIQIGSGFAWIPKGLHESHPQRDIHKVWVHGFEDHEVFVKIHRAREEDGVRCTTDTKCLL